MLIEIKTIDKHFFIDEYDRAQGEYKEWYRNGRIYKHCYYTDNELHGEYKKWYENGQLAVHCLFSNGLRHGECKHMDMSMWYSFGKKQTIKYHFFYINGEQVLFDKLPYPETPEDCMYFKLKYNIPLLPLEAVC